MRGLAVGFVILWCAVWETAGAIGQDAGVDHPAEYQACLALAETDPAAAYKSGLVWFKASGGLPARHCVAVALVGLGDHEAAATRFEILAGEVTADRDDLRAGMLGQAGQAWLLAGRPVRASQAQGAALSLRPKDPGLLVDRAVSLITSGRYPAALADLNKALEIAPGFADAYLYRASVKRYLNDLGGAWVDVTDALVLAPGLPAAVLERGILHHRDEDLDAARADWLKVIETAPRSEEAGAARARIEAMDLRQ